MKSIQVGDSAPDFTATASDGRQISSADFKGKQAVVIFFYPKDNSLVCTREACSFRDTYEEFVRMGAAVIGVSGDSDDSHRSFASANQLPYPMIADRDGRLRRLFGVPNTLFLIPGRVTYVIDRNGVVRHKFKALLAGSQHAEEALQAVRKLTDAATA